MFYLHGYTLNRITLFALIFSIGILVDDAIVVVENIVRHFHLPHNKGRSWSAIAVEAVNEVGNPDHPGHLRRDLGGAADGLCRRADGALHAAHSHRVQRRDVLVAGHRLHRHALGRDPDSALGPEVFPTDGRRLACRRGPKGRQAALPTFRARGGLLHPALPALHGAADCQDPLAAGLPGGIVVLLLASMATVGLGWVKVKMLPFDNKSEFQIILNMPEGSALEHTAQAAREIAAAVRVEPEVTDYQVYAGVAAPFNFNGLVRHYFMRRGPHIADLQVNLVPKGERKAQSHDIAKRVRPRVARIAAKYGARVAVAEVPPGPPVLQTLVAEVYGPNEDSRLALAHKVIDIFHHTTGVVDTDWYIEADQTKVRFIVDKEKAALHGISDESHRPDLEDGRRRRRGGFAAPAAREGGRADRGAPAAIPAHIARGPAGPARPRRQSRRRRSCPCASWSRWNAAWWTRASTTRT